MMESSLKKLLILALVVFIMSFLAGFLIMVYWLKPDFIKKEGEIDYQKVVPISFMIGFFSVVFLIAVVIVFGRYFSY